MVPALKRRTGAILYFFKKYVVYLVLTDTKYML